MASHLPERVEGGRGGLGGRLRVNADGGEDRGVPLRQRDRATAALNRRAGRDHDSHPGRDGPGDHRITVRIERRGIQVYVCIDPHVRTRSRGTHRGPALAPDAHAGARGEDVDGFYASGGSPSTAGRGRTPPTGGGASRRAGTGSGRTGETTAILGPSRRRN